jgi:hypothetical protein
MKDGDIIGQDGLAELMAQADSLEREMLLVMRQAIAVTLAHEAGRPKIALYQHSRLGWQPGAQFVFLRDGTPDNSASGR